jgi:hypothetical protein
MVSGSERFQIFCRRIWNFTADIQQKIRFRLSNRNFFAELWAIGGRFNTKNGICLPQEHFGNGGDKGKSFKLALFRRSRKAQFVRFWLFRSQNDLAVVNLVSA